MTLFDLRAMARALDGEVRGADVFAPGPNRPPSDRSLRVSLCAASPTGFIAHSSVGDDFMRCRDHVAARLAESTPK